MASAIDLTLDDDDSVELMGPPVTDLTADSQDSLPPPRRAPAAPAPAAAPVATESQQEAPAALQAPQDAGPAPAPEAPPAPPPPRPGTLLARKAKFSYFDTFEDTDDELETTHVLRIESAREDDSLVLRGADVEAVEVGVRDERPRRVPVADRARHRRALGDALEHTFELSPCVNTENGWRRLIGTQSMVISSTS